MQNLIISEFVGLAVLFQYFFFLCFKEAFQFFGVCLVFIVVGVLLVGPGSFLLQPEDGLVDFFALGLVVLELFVEDFLEPLEGEVVGGGSFVFGDLLPGSFDVWHFSRVECIHVAVHHH